MHTLTCPHGVCEHGSAVWDRGLVGSDTNKGSNEYLGTKIAGRSSSCSDPEVGFRWNFVLSVCSLAAVVSFYTGEPIISHPPNTDQPLFRGEA